MPRLTRWFVKAALIYFVAALLISILMQAPGVRTDPVNAVMWPTYLHLFIVGWITQLIFGVAFWLFPRYSADRPRGSERLGWWSFGLLNLGLLLRTIGEPWHLLGGGTEAGGFLVGAAVLQAGAGWAFVVNTWPRIRER
jgi:heme/copper-type cytochrome/quinol oxidase subunit 1